MTDRAAYDVINDFQLIQHFEDDLDLGLQLQERQLGEHPAVAAARAVIALPDSDPSDVVSADGVRTPDAIPWHQLDQVPLEEDTAKVVRYVITELVRNVEEHAAASNGGSIRVRIFSAPDRVAIGVADRGIGVRRSLSRFHRAADDAGAIALAVTPGITGSTAKLGGNEVNAGAGLFFMRRLAAISGTAFLVMSGQAAWHVPPRDAGGDDTSEGVALPMLEGRWVGTAAFVDLPLHLPQSRQELFRRINLEYDSHVKDARHQLHRRRSLLSEG